MAVNKTRAITIAAGAALVLFGARTASAQGNTVTLQIQFDAAKPAKRAAAAEDRAGVVLWLTPVGAKAPAAAPAAKPVATIAQQNKSFTPHVIAVQVGSAIAFPNKDHFLHNVFSLHDGKQFDLGFYEAGSSKAVRFERPGVSYLFCNIHPEMTAAVVVVETPYFALSDSTGRISLANVPDGKYVLHLWSERSLPEDLKKMEREVTVSSGATELGALRIHENPDFSSAHKNKYGQDYIPASAAGDYNQP